MLRTFLRKTRQLHPAAVALAAVAAIAAFQMQVLRLPRSSVLEQIDSDTPIVARLVLAGGDPYLAANAAVFRALIANLRKLDEVSINLLAKVQDDASRLNPAHADNYYVAQGTLPWIGNHLEITNKILERASDSRNTDFMPDFFIGVNAWYFRQDFAQAGFRFKRAGDKVGPPMREQLWSISANYYDKSDNIEVGRRALLHLREIMTDPQQKLVIDARLQRLAGLEKLRNAAAEFKRTSGKPLDSLEQLVAARLIDEIPKDPLNLGYTVDAGGTPRLVVRQSAIKK